VGCFSISNVPAGLLGMGTASLSSGSWTYIQLNTTDGSMYPLRPAGPGLEAGIWFEVVVQPDGSELAVWSFAGGQLSSGTPLYVVGDRGVVLISDGDLTIGSTLIIDGDGVAANGFEGGVGSDASGVGATGGTGDGPGAAGVAAGLGPAGGDGGAHRGGGGGGGGWTTPGLPGSLAAGGAGANGSGDGGAPYGTLASPSPLTFGSGGGGGVTDPTTGPAGDSANGGAPGGSLQISVAGQLTVNGYVSAEGGGGDVGEGGGGGGGSGGMVLLEAEDLLVTGTITVQGRNGGIGDIGGGWAPGGTGGLVDPWGLGGPTPAGGGGGGAGRIVLRTLNSSSLPGALYPSLGSPCVVEQQM
jgi:hypothetical protein